MSKKNKKESKERDDENVSAESVPVNYLAGKSPSAYDLPLSPWQSDRVKKAIASFSKIKGSPDNISNRMYCWLRKHYDVKSYRMIKASEYQVLIDVIKCQYVAYKKYVSLDAKLLTSACDDIPTSTSSEKNKTASNSELKTSKKSKVSTEKDIIDTLTEDMSSTLVVAKRRNVTKLMALCANRHMGKQSGNVASLKSEYAEYRTATDMALAWHPSGANGSPYIGVILKRHDLSNFKNVDAYAVRLNDLKNTGKKCKVTMYPPEVQEIVLNDLIKEGRVVEEVLNRIRNNTQ